MYQFNQQLKKTRPELVAQCRERDQSCQKQHIALNWLLSSTVLSNDHCIKLSSKNVAKDLNLWRNVKRETKVANLLRQEPGFWNQTKISLKTNWNVSETDLISYKNFRCSFCFQWTKLVTKTQPVWVVTHGMGQNIVVPKNKPLETPWNRFRESEENTLVGNMFILIVCFTFAKWTCV